MSIFTSLFYQPVLNLLVVIYKFVPGNDIGLAIILMTVLIRLLLWPLSRQSIRSQKALQELQPQLEEIKKKYGDNKEELGQKTMALYRENNVNPFSSCLPLLVQLPFLFAVFRVFSNGLSNVSLDLVYHFVGPIISINPISLGLVDLSTPNIYLAVASGLTQYWQSKTLITKKPEIKTEGARDESMLTAMNKQMVYFMPAITVFIGLTLPGGLTLYWLTTTLLTILQQWLTFKKRNNRETKAV